MTGMSVPSAKAAPTHDVNDDVNGGPVVDVADEAPAPVVKKSTKKAAKSTAKKAKSKKAKSSALPRKQNFLKAPANAKASKPGVPGHARPILGTPDPNVDEPSEMITAIKNNAQDKFWAGKRPYPEQLRERAQTPPSAPVFTGAIAQKELQKRGTAEGMKTAGTAHSNALTRVSYSEISGVTFDDQPLRMNSSEAFRRSLDTVSFELGRPCKNQEYLGWPMQQSEQARVDRLFEETNERLKLRGYNLQPRKARSVGSDVAAFTADRGDKRLLGIWSAGDVGLLLLMCDSETPQDAAYAAKMKQKTDAGLQSKKSKVTKTKKKAKKKSAPSRKLFQAGGEAPAVAAPSESTGSATQPDAPSKPADPNSAPLGTTAPQAQGADAVPPPPVPTTTTPLIPAAPETEAKPQVIPGAPAKNLPVEPEASSAPAAPAAPAINPSSAFIPADAPTAAKEAVKDATKDAIKDVAPSMKALPPEMPTPGSNVPPVTDVKP